MVMAILFFLDTSKLFDSSNFVDLSDIYIFIISCYKLNII